MNLLCQSGSASSQLCNEHICVHMIRSSTSLQRLHHSFCSLMISFKIMFAKDIPTRVKKTIGWLALCTSGLMSLASAYHLRAPGAKAKQRTRTTRTYGPHQADRRRLQRCSCVHRWPAAWVDTPIVNRAVRHPRSSMTQ